jgi:hypothetical protein
VRDGEHEGLAEAGHPHLGAVPGDGRVETDGEHAGHAGGGVGVGVVGLVRVLAKGVGVLAGEHHDQVERLAGREGLW